MSTPFLCPICHRALAREGSSLRCEKRHCFDIASEGYVNLAIGKNDAGDNADMCRARHAFLEAGYYRLFADAIAETLSEYRPLAICDAGCGEGFYLRTLQRKLPNPLLVGLDLAKTSVKLAAKAEKGKDHPIHYAVAGIFDMPLPDTSFDTVLSIFAPVPDREAHRVLQKDGLLIVAHPGKSHLMGLKRLLYQNPYENEEKDFSFPDFIKLRDIRIAYPTEVLGEQIESLFLMTPYFWKTSKEDTEKLRTVSSLVTELDFILSVYQKQ